MHAEATSEKIAMAGTWMEKSRRSLARIPTCRPRTDRILPNGTAYLTDAGMTGPHDSIIGMEKEPSLARFLNGMPTKFEPGDRDPRMNAVVIEADEKTGRATKITRISYSEQELLGGLFEHPERVALDATF